MDRPLRIQYPGAYYHVTCRLERAMLMELLYRFCQITQPEIGRLAGGIDYSAVSQARNRLQIRLERESELKKRFDKLSS